jgi:predicted dehydrogenase
MGILGDRYDLECIESAVMKSGLDEVDPGTGVYDVEEHFVVNMQLTGQTSYYWERGAHANMEIPNETRIYGTRGGIKLAYCTWEHPVISFYDLDEKGISREQKINVDMKDHPNDGLALINHFISVLDGEEPPVISLELAKKHMEIILACRDKADGLL